MRIVRFLFSAGVTVILLCGYLGSQVYAFSGRAKEWARMVDTPGIQWSALAVLAAAIALAIVPGGEETK